MARARVYVCDCGEKFEVIFGDKEEIPEHIECKKEGCKKIAILDFISNVGATGPRWRWRD